MNIDHLTIDEIRALKIQVDRICQDAEPGGYDAWDWTKTNVELAALHGVSYATVSARRRRLGKAKVTKYYPACLGWDWAKTDVEIARENSVELGTVRNWRKRLQQPNPTVFPLTLKQSPKSEITEARLGRLIDWTTADWTKHDVAIARSLGATRERVRQKRAALGLPKRPWDEVKYQDFLAKVGELKVLSMADIIKLGIDACHVTISRYCAKAGITRIRSPKPSTIPWDKMNWQLSNQTLHIIWGVSTQYIASRRSNHQPGLAKLKSLGLAERTYLTDKIRYSSLNLDWAAAVDHEWIVKQEYEKTKENHS